ncbi:MAG: DNA-binding response OmpR family regulator [Parvicella sp.]|jgi:DNA-binding response OmpR family regulator
MEVKDTLKDDRFKDNQFVTEPPHLRFYAGISITTKDGFNVGTLCVMGYEPRALSEDQKAGLLEIGKSISFILEESLNRNESENNVRKVVQSHTHKINNTLAIALARLDVDKQIEESSKEATGNAIKRASAQIIDISNQFKLPFHLIEAETPVNEVKAESQSISRTIQSGHQTIPLQSLTHLDAGFSSSTFKPSLVIVEDDVELGKILATMLSEIFTVTLLHEGETARQKLNELQPDVALLDWMLPKVQGIELCRHIKRQKDLTFTKVVLLTAKQDDESKLLALNSGADDFLSKPISSLEIKTRLSNLAARVKLEKQIQNQNDQLSNALEELKALELQLILGAKLSAIGGLASGLLHEVNNPLNYVMTALQLISRESKVKNDPDLSELTTDIQTGWSAFG